MKLMKKNSFCTSHSKAEGQLHLSVATWLWPIGCKKDCWPFIGLSGCGTYFSYTNAVTEMAQSHPQEWGHWCVTEGREVSGRHLSVLGKNVSRLERGLRGWERLTGWSDEGSCRRCSFWVGKIQERVSGVATNVSLLPYLLLALCHCTTEEILSHSILHAEYFYIVEKCGL